MARIVLDRVTKVFGSECVAVDDVSLDVAPGEFVVLVGPSGCGKSTILRLIAGLEDVTAGEIYVGDELVTDARPKERDVAMVFQNYALYPHMTVEQNIGFGLRLHRTPKQELQTRVRQVAKVLGLTKLLHRKPYELSGGQRQRVAMGRAMVREPKAFLMDEPLSNLDAKLRVQMRAELARLHDRLGTTTVYVTHDQIEAMTLGHRVAVLKDGALQQLDTPQRLYREPANLFVAAFMGSPPMNLVEAKVAGRRLEFADYELPVVPAADLSAYDGATVILGIRPSEFHDTAVWQPPDHPTLDVTVDVVEDLGSEVNLLFMVDTPPVETEETIAAAADERAADGELPLLSDDGGSAFCARVDARTTARAGRNVRLSVDPTGFHFFDPHTGRRITAASGGRGITCRAETPAGPGT
ncbi:MAG TPA: sn-glycerol-3-phosphate ABC transporter ATP-binding protein UgpC [Acidimicrobiales bacterium]|nr:sn-glycerol-3-phosphate ABC transporter ATP-binding protein UgpC [Acidimicrobiales bacterium]